jgi:outer membrane lipoprotein-sorting protein
MKKTLTMSILFLSLGLMAQDGEALLAKVDERLTFTTDMSCVFQMITYRAGEQPTEQILRMFVRPEEVDGEDKFLAVVERPRADKGTAYLGIGDNFWIYDPVSGAYSHSTARENVQDSDVNNDDLGVANFQDDYDVVKIEEGMLGNIPVYILDLEATVDTVDYNTIKLWVGREDNLPYKEEDYSLSGTLMRTILAPKWSKIGDKYIYREVYFIDELKQGNKTTLKFANVSLQRLDDATFTKQNLAVIQ